MKKLFTFSIFSFLFAVILLSQDSFNSELNNREFNKDGIDITDKILNLYPNTVLYDFTLEFYTENYYDINIMNSKGRTVYEQQNVSEKVIINCQDMPSGIYILKVLNLSDYSYLSRRIIKQ